MEPGKMEATLGLVMKSFVNEKVVKLGIGTNCDPPAVTVWSVGSTALGYNFGKEEVG